MTHAVLLVMVAAALMVPARESFAAPPQRTPMLVFESHVGDRPAELAALLDMLSDSLETHGFVADPASFKRLLGGRAPHPGVVDVGKTAADIAQRVNGGVHEYIVGKFDEAITTLTGALEQIHRNPGLLVVDTKNADMIVRAHMALALAHSRLGRVPDSVATMTELIRISRGQPISRADFGPDADKLYRSVLKQVQALGRGNLAISTGDDRAMIFVDGSLRGMGKATLGDLIPGHYRVFVQVPGTTGRRYAIEVTPNEDHYLDVKTSIEESLWIDAWIGFRFATEADRKLEARFASELARLWTGEGLVAVIGPTQLQGKPAVIGTLYRTDGSVVRSASIETEGADRERLRSLAKFIADGTPGDDLDIRGGQPAEEPAPVPTTAQSPSIWPKLVVVGGIAALGASVSLFAVDEDPDPAGAQQPTYRDTAPAAVVFGAAGVAMVGAGVWWWLRGSQAGAEASRPAIAIGATSASVGWTAQF